MRGFLKKMFISSLVLIAATSFSTKASANQIFSDVSTSDEGYQEIEYIYNKGIIKGYTVNGKQYYKPGEVLKRSQAAKMLVEASNQKPLIVSKSSFTDVKVGTEASGYIERAVKSGFLKGNSDGTFGINKPLTRDDMSIALAKAFNLSLTEFANKPIIFTDIAETSNIAKYVKAIYYNGLTQGDGNKYLPHNGVTRKHFALFVARGMEDTFKLEVGGITTPDSDQSIGKVIVTLTNDTLNVRTEPNTSSTIVGKVNNGDILEVYEKIGDWLKVDYQGELHYISSDFTAFLDINGQPIKESTGQVQITSAELNVRSKPLATSSVVGVLLKNEKVETYGLYDGWYLVKMNGVPGYINAKYTSSETDGPEEPVTPPPTGLGNLAGKVTVASVNIRSGPGASYPTVGKLTKGMMVSVQSINGFWAKVKYDGGEGYTHKSYLKLLNQSGSVLKNRIILIDPGHGGTDPGASSKGVTEKSIVIKVAKLVEQKLKSQGATVIMTRTGDTYPTLPARVALAKSTFSEIYVSIHVNAINNASVTGTETFYNLTSNDNGAESKILATKIHSEIVKNANMVDRRIKEADFYVNRMVDIPSVLVELGFITNQADLNKLISDKYLEIYAQSIYNGIVDYYSAP